MSKAGSKDLAAADLDPARLEAILADHELGSNGDLAGPVQVLDTARSASGRKTIQFSASRLVPVDETDPDLRDIAIPVPVTGEVQLEPDGSLGAVAMPPPDPAIAREARAFARNLIANGAVRGIGSPSARVRRSPGPPPRATHEVTTDDQGRRIIRRTGFAATGGIADRPAGS